MWIWWKRHSGKLHSSLENQPTRKAAASAGSPYLTWATHLHVGRCEGAWHVRLGRQFAGQGLNLHDEFWGTRPGSTRSGTFFQARQAFLKETFASCLSLVLGYSRIPFAAARDGNFFAVFSRAHPRKEFPHVSLLLVGAVAIVCSLLPLLTVINALLTTRILVQFIGQIGAVWWLRRHQPEAERPFKMWLYPLPTFVALTGWLFLFGTTDLTTLLYSLGVLAAGVLVFLGWSRWTRRWPFAGQVPAR
jgi:hypothetical protein